jgi:hypothetical protein
MLVDSLLWVALEYRERGWSIVPLCPPDHSGNLPPGHIQTCTCPGKQTPYRWKEWMKRLPPAELLREKWGENPRLNVGLVLGQVSGLVAIDVDGPAGRELLRELSHQRQGRPRRQGRRPHRRRPARRALRDRRLRLRADLRPAPRPARRRPATPGDPRRGGGHRQEADPARREHRQPPGGLGPVAVLAPRARPRPPWAWPCHIPPPAQIPSRLLRTTWQRVITK